MILEPEMIEARATRTKRVKGKVKWKIHVLSNPLNSDKAEVPDANEAHATSAYREEMSTWKISSAAEKQ